MQEKKISLEFTVDDVNILFKALDELPHKIARRVVDYILSESQKQLQPKEQPLDTNPK